MTTLIQPHGGVLKPLLAAGDYRTELLKLSHSLVQIKLGSKEFSDLIMLATGAFSPLDGFMREGDYRRVLAEMQLQNGTLWPIPVCLPVSKAEAAPLQANQKVALTDEESGAVVGIMTVEEKYTYDKEAEASAVFGTKDPEHPGVKKLFAQGEVYLGGAVTALSEGAYPQQYAEFARPAETRAGFAEKGWKTIAAFQTRNPIHRSHEYLTKVALEICDGIFIHPIVGKLKDGDIPAEVRMQCYRALLEQYYPQDRVLLKVYPMEMRYAGPKEAVLHAIIRQNFGCTHLIVGRDHAGVGDHYGPFEAQNIFDQLPAGSLKIQPLKIDWTFWCHKCAAMASFKTCPHGNEDHLMIGGTKLREMLTRGEKPPEQFSRPEVLDILLEYYAGGVTVK